MKQLVYIVFFLMPFIGIAQNCEEYKTGVFKCKVAGGEWIPNYKIIRRKKVQIEKSEEGYNKSKVVWVDDCTYQLIHIKSNYLNLRKGNITTVRIVEVTENGYQAVGSSEATLGSKIIIMKRIN